MNDWTAGYVADVGYTFGYYTELNPLRVQLAFLQAGLALPGQGAACELGFGQGLSANVHAAAGVFQWSGTDFNPSQAGFARELAAASGVSANLFDDAFADFCARVDLPDFDYIGLHGADSSTKRNKDEPGDGWLRMPRHHGRSNRQVQVTRCTSTSAEKNDTKSTVS